jgi:zinc protease
LNVTKETSGIENLLLRVASEGSLKFPRTLMRREMSKTGSEIGGGASLDYSVLSLASTRQHFDKSWEIFTDIALNPAFAADDFKLIQDQLVTALQSQADEPEGYLQVLKDKKIFANHPYSNNPSGTVEAVSALSPRTLRTYHKQMMQTSRMLMVVVGDVNPDELKAKIASSFGKLPVGSYKENAMPQIDFAKSSVNVTTRDLPTNYIQGEFSAPNLNNPDYIAMRVATKILQGRVFEEVRVKRNLSYAPNADMNELNANTGNIYVTAVDANRSIDIMINEITRLQKDMTDESEISGVAGGFLTTYFLGQETNSAQAAEIARYELITPEKVKQVSIKYMKNLKFVVLGNPASINKEIFTQK